VACGEHKILGALAGLGLRIDGGNEMIYIASGKWAKVGDWVWGRVYTGNGNKPKLVRGEILSIEKDAYTSVVDIRTKRGQVYHLPSNVLHVKKPRPVLIEDELGSFTSWEE